MQIQYLRITSLLNWSRVSGCCIRTGSFSPARFAQAGRGIGLAEGMRQHVGRYEGNVALDQQLFSKRCLPDSRCSSNEVNHKACELCHEHSLKRSPLHSARAGLGLEIAAELAVVRAKASEDEALIAQQQLQIANLKHQIYGQRSERSSRLIEQLALTFEELETDATEDTSSSRKNWRWHVCIVLCHSACNIGSEQFLCIGIM